MADVNIPESVSPEELVSKDIFELLNLENLGEQEKNEIRANMLAAIRNRTLARVDDLLDEDGKKQYSDLLSQPESEESDKAISDFLTSKDIDINKLTVEETILVKAQAVNTLKAAQPKE